MSDLALRLQRSGYRGIERDRAARRGAQTYATRLLGRRAVVLGGAAGATLFYDEEAVQRHGAVPPPLAWLLFGRGAVHGLDDEEHQQRKSLFLSMLGPRDVAACAAEAGRRLEGAVPGWRGRTIRVHDELVAAYGAAVLAWVGLDLDENFARSLSRRYAQIVDGFGFAGASYPRAWQARLLTDRWAQAAIGDVRHGRLTVTPDSVVARIATSPLNERIAAVELGNVIRPTIAVSWLGTHAVLAMHVLEGRRTDLADPERETLRWSFAQEVRRTTPFVPALAGVARRGTTHNGVEIAAGDRVVLDVTGMNHDPDRYGEPGTFRIDRFLETKPTPYDLVPQGGGPPEGHRCPGESMTLQLLVESVRVLSQTPFRLESPPRTHLARIPALPVDRTRISVLG